LGIGTMVHDGHWTRAHCPCGELRRLLREMLGAAGARVMPDVTPIR
jgi:hypothetical protein